MKMHIRNIKIFSVALAACIIISGLFSSILHAQESGDGVHYNKSSVFDYETMSGTIVLESFVEGEVKSTPAPIDVVMVLDVSDSMKGDKFTSLKSSAKHVVSMLNDLVNNGGDARLGIVSYARDATTNAELTQVNDTGATILNAAVDGLTLGNTTYMNKGMSNAYNLLNTPESKARTQFVLFFTDGKPGDNTGDYSVANGTFNKSYEIKKMGAQIFSVLLWDSKTDPSSNYIANISGTSSPGNTNLGSKLSVEMFLQCVSSLYPWYYDIYSNGDTYSPTVKYRYYQNYGSTLSSVSKFSDVPKADTDIEYYRWTKNSSDLNDIFSSIGSLIVSGASIELEETTVMKDILSTYCTLPPNANASLIKTYTANCTNYNAATHEYTFGEKEPISGLDISVNENTKTVEISGFDYSGHWCGYDSSAGHAVGQKLIVEVPYYLDASKIIEDNIFEVNLNLDGSGLYTAEGLLEVFIPAQFSYKTAVISISGLNTGDSAIFEVTSTKSGVAKHAYSVVLTGKDDSGSSVSTSLMFLDPEAKYTVTEQTPWNWTYSMAPGSSASVIKDFATETSNVVQFDFANVKKTSELPINGEAIKINDFTNDIVQTNVTVSEPENSTKKIYF